MTTEIVRHRDGQVLVLTLDRPTKFNALTYAMYDVLRAALTEASADPSVAVVLICANGTAFCAGNDITEFVGSKRGTHAIDFIRVLASFDKPLVAAVHGYAVGIGMTMLLHCDLVYATSEARFRVPFVNLGLVPEAGSSLLLPARIGRARAAPMLLLGETMTAEQALSAGFVTELFPAAQLLDGARDKAFELSRQPPQALAATRALIRPDPKSLHKRIDEEAILFEEALASPEAREAFAAFLEKRAPVFDAR